MKKSLIWITAGIATVGFGVPAFAARGDSPEHIAPSTVTVATTPATVAAAPVVAATPAAAPVVSNDDNGVDNTTANSVDDNGIDATENSVEDVSGPCDEAEHATDPACAGVTAASTDDGVAHDATDDNSAHSGGGDDASGHQGGGNDG